MISIFQTVLNLAENMLKLQKMQRFRKKLQKFQLFGKNAKISKFLEKFAKISRFWQFFVASDLIEKYFNICGV